MPSGYALKLALGPLDALIGMKRPARECKYRLLLMVQRLYQAGLAEGWAAGETVLMRLPWPPHTPTDRGAVLEEVVKAETVVMLLLEAGIQSRMCRRRWSGSGRKQNRGPRCGWRRPLRGRARVARRMGPGGSHS